MISCLNIGAKWFLAAFNNVQGKIKDSGLARKVSKEVCKLLQLSYNGKE